MKLPFALTEFTNAKQVFWQFLRGSVTTRSCCSRSRRGTIFLHEYLSFLKIWTLLTPSVIANNPLLGTPSNPVSQHLELLGKTIMEPGWKKLSLVRTSAKDEIHFMVEIFIKISIFLLLLQYFAAALKKLALVSRWVLTRQNIEGRKVTDFFWLQISAINWWSNGQDAWTKIPLENYCSSTSQIDDFQLEFLSWQSSGPEFRDVWLWKMLASGWGSLWESSSFVPWLEIYVFRDVSGAVPEWPWIRGFMRKSSRRDNAPNMLFSVPLNAWDNFFVTVPSISSDTRVKLSSCDLGTFEFYAKLLPGCPSKFSLFNAANFLLFLRVACHCLREKRLSVINIWLSLLKRNQIVVLQSFS